MSDPARNDVRAIRLWLAIFITGLVLSGLTAFPLEREIGGIVRGLAAVGVPTDSSLMIWMVRVRDALADVGRRHPFLPYGTDWLAFAHLVISVAFVGPWRDPVRNRWVIDWGLIACAMVIPLALIAGPIRGIPWGWRLIDCSFGVFGAIPLLVVRRRIARLASAG